MAGLLRNLLKRVLVWWLPFLLALGGVALAFVAWMMATQSGTAMLLRIVAAQLDGQASRVRGTLLDSVQVGALSLNLPGAAIDAQGLNLNVDWRALSRGLLRVQDLSADVLRVSTTSLPEDDPGEGGAAVVIPVDVAVDRLAVGRFELVLDGEPLPVAVDDFRSTVALGKPGLQLRIASLRLAHPLAHARLQGELRLTELSDPWPMDVRLLASLHGPDAASPVCLADRLPGASLAGKSAGNGVPQAGKGPAAPIDASGDGQGDDAPGCTILSDVAVQGSLQELAVAVTGDGPGLALRAQAQATPRDAIPVRQADVDVKLGDGSALGAQLQWRAAPNEAGGPGQAPATSRERLRIGIDSRNFDVGKLLAGAMAAPAALSGRLEVDAELVDRAVVSEASIKLVLDEGSRWNGQPLAGTLAAQVRTDGPTADWARLQVPRLDADLRLGANRLRGQGAWGDAASALELQVQAPRLADLWPGLSGKASAKARLAGTVARHSVRIDADYVPPDARDGLVGRAPGSVRLEAAGGWGGGAGDFQAGVVGWRGTVSALDASHAGYRVRGSAIPVAFLPDAVAPQWQWQVGRARLDVALPGQAAFALAHEGSRGGGQRWQTAGRIDEIAITAALVRAVRATLDADVRPQPQGSGRVNRSAPGAQRRILLGASWDLSFAGALAGVARIERRSGDLRIPGDPPVPLGLRRLALEAKAVAAGATSRVQATLDVDTERMGSLRGSAAATLVAGQDGALSLAPRQPVRVDLRADVADLAWVGLFTGDSLEVGGSLRADVQAEGVPGGQWQARGTVKGEKLRVVRIDDGVRLVDGTLSARLQDQRVILESLRFPASLRVIPSEWRTREWITKDADAQGGYLSAAGHWDLAGAGGEVSVTLHRFPALQRSDRYAMVTGKVDIKAALPSLSIIGDLTADAGWASLEILSEVPTLDDDVIVVRAGDDVRTPDGMQVFMDMGIDLGKRFYLTGMGLDSGLVGSLRIRLEQGRLTGNGVLRTRGGRFEAYGQRLHLRRGTITFQDSLDNPLLDIEALRLGEQVEAGVRVAGTAQRPRIDLVSYPDVSEVEKLSWLILGRGPDQGGSDAALLLSVGTALLGGGEPFYRQFGLDDVGLKSGAIGSSGSLLPDVTVASNVTRSGASELETQFLVASKRFANGITLSLEQGLAGAETVGRASYRLSRHWSVDLKAGAVNGLELIYRTFWDD